MPCPISTCHHLSRNRSVTLHARTHLPPRACRANTNVNSKRCCRPSSSSLQTCERRRHRLSPPCLSRNASVTVHARTHLPPSSMPRKYKHEQQALLLSPRHPRHANVRAPPPSPIAPSPSLCNGDDEDDDATMMTHPRCLHLRLCLPCPRPPRNEDATRATMRRHTITLSLVVLSTHLAKIQVCSRRSPLVT